MASNTYCSSSLFPRDRRDAEALLHVAERDDPRVSDHNMTSACCVGLTLLKLAMCDK